MQLEKENYYSNNKDKVVIISQDQPRKILKTYSKFL